MLERFQEENPGFDFSNAQFNGQAPNPRDFMGGVNYKWLYNYNFYGHRVRSSYQRLGFRPYYCSNVHD